MNTTTATHTPGPWMIRPFRGGFIRDSISICGTSIQEITALSAPPDRFHEQAANARLIAAAPELLAALNAMLNADEAICENIGTLSDQAMQWIAAVDAAQAAIAKATEGTR
jgi:hypothetical protein